LSSAPTAPTSSGVPARSATEALNELFVSVCRRVQLVDGFAADDLLLDLASDVQAILCRRPGPP
jgi:hypothetical protein